MSPKEACEYARECGPSNETREIACESPVWAYIYAWIIDRNPRNETREAASKNSKYAYFYALNVDQEARNDTWLAVKNTEYEEKYKKIFNEPIKEKII